MSTYPPRCPNCNIAMVLRTAKRGKFEGKQFWGCVRYPNCKNVVSFAEVADASIAAPLSTEVAVSFMHLAAQRKKNAW